MVGIYYAAGGAKRVNPEFSRNFSAVTRIRCAGAPKRSTFSHANRTRNPEIAEQLYWAVFGHLQTICPSFTQYKKHKGFIHRVKREIFFKELKQTLQLRDFVGYNEKAVKWQVWTGLLAHLLLRFLKHVSKWALSFSSLAGTVKSAVWMKIDLLDALPVPWSQ